MLEDLDERLGVISRAHAGAHAGAHGVFDLLSGQGASLNADRRFVAASLSKLYALLKFHKAAPKAS